MKGKNMLRRCSLILFVIYLMVMGCSVYAEGTVGSDYDLYYSQFVDSTEPLSTLQNKDLVIDRTAAYANRPVLSAIPDENRVDYFNVPYGSDPMQKLDIHHLKGNKKRPVVVFIHGGGWTGGDKDQSRFLGPKLISLGYTFVSINYRLAPNNRHPAQIEDCAIALKWIMENIHDYGGNPNRIAISGHSAGGHLAALLVTGTKWQEKYGIDIKKVKFWFPLSGIYDFNLKETYYHPLMAGFNNALLDSLDKKTDASPVTYVTGNEPPSLITHGGDDWLVPRTNAISLYNELVEKGATTELNIVRGYCHANTYFTFGDEGDVPSKLIIERLAKYLPTSENNLGNYKDDTLKKAN